MPIELICAELLRALPPVKDTVQGHLNKSEMNECIFNVLAFLFLFTTYFRLPLLHLANGSPKGNVNRTNDFASKHCSACDI